MGEDMAIPGLQARRWLVLVIAVPAAFVVTGVVLTIMRTRPAKVAAARAGAPSKAREERPGPSRPAAARRTFAEPSSRAIQLLPLIDPTFDGVVGEWRSVSGALMSPLVKGKPTSLLVPYIPPEEYDLILVVQRKVGEEALHIGLASGDAQFTVVIGAKWDRGYFSGLDLIDGKGFDRNESTALGEVFRPEHQSAVVCSVRRSGVTVEVDGTAVIRWEGSLNRLSRGSFFKFPHPQALCLGSWETAYLVSRMFVEPVTGTGKRLR